MKRIALILAFVISLICFPAFAKDVYVKGYTKKDGTYVQPHYRSAPDGTPYNNWSTKGNANPYTGQPGYKDPYPSYNPYNTHPSNEGQKKRY